MVVYFGVRSCECIGYLHSVEDRKAATPLSGHENALFLIYSRRTRMGVQSYRKYGEKIFCQTGDTKLKK